MQKVLITVSEGFIGKALAASHNSAKYSSITLDNSENDESTYKSDVKNERITEIFYGESPDIVIHPAAQIDVMQSFKDPIGDLENKIQPIIAKPGFGYIQRNSRSNYLAIETIGCRPTTSLDAGLTKSLGLRL